ncbi:polysaccharide deacetylase family protein [Thalassobacillus sp. C254]|uniref:polysaccharide deacetylase family protein n=1 Tax=Thalassobacillus sp. C254 TaxID=1225341 RepID=UPI000B20C872|nr:polysaccharide deacetylase family protein [Thalassobacillus sp. C254]
MMRKRFILIQLFVFAIIGVISYSAVYNPFSTEYIQEVKQEARMASTTMQQSLYEQIQEAAEQYNEPAVDAVVDKVWKAVPGYNGRVVDIDASYKKMNQKGQFDKDLLVFKEESPKVHLSDLPPTPIYKGNSQKPMVAFLVNVAWGNEYLPDMLKTFQKHNVKATFFLDGSWVKNNPKLAKMILEEGHEIGNHAYSHPDLKQMSNERIHEEILKTNETIQAALDVKPRWFAPPSGSYRQDVVDIAHEHGMGTIMWTLDTIDWKSPEPSSMAARIVKDSHPGAMILMHPTGASRDGLESMITGMKEKGLKIGTVSRLVDEGRVQ